MHKLSKFKPIGVFSLIFSLLMVVTLSLSAQQTDQSTFKNPILSGFHPDPSICRVGDEYYLVTSSFTWFPGLPIYHSKDLVNWKLVGHGLSKPGMIAMNGVNDNDGIWAPTIRYHNGLFYIITTAHKCGGNFYITASDPEGPWSDPVWLKEATGIDPSLFWDDNGKCYYTGNDWSFKKSWPSQVAVWMQEIDFTKGEFIGERKILTYGHANNATFAEGPHIYKIDGKYLLLMAEGGSGYNHAVTAHSAKSIFGPYISNSVNPVLSHRQLGKNYPIQNIGHADLVQTQHGEWYAVALGIRQIDGLNPLARETFLCKVDFENGTPIFNPGEGKVLSEMRKPNLPWNPVKQEPAKDEFDADKLASKWYFVRIPANKFYELNNGQLTLSLLPVVVDSLVNSAMIIQKTQHHSFIATTKMSFQTNKANEQAGLIYYRTANGYYSLMKEKEGIVLTRRFMGKSSLVQRVSYTHKNVYLKTEAQGLYVQFSYGESTENMKPIGTAQKLDNIADNKMNKFNGPGIGMYATSNGIPSKNKAVFDWFECIGKE